LKPLPLENLCDVEIEKVAIENGLNTSGHNSDDIVERLSVVAIDPVENVETTVRAESEQIVAGNTLGLTSLGHHEQLGQDGHRLQIDREGPQDLHQGKFVVQKKGKKNRRAKEKLDPKGVMIAIIGCLELEIHQIDSCCS